MIWTDSESSETAILLIGTSEVVVEVSSTLVVEGLVVVEVSSTNVVDVVTAASHSELVFETDRKDENTIKAKIKLVTYLLFIVTKHLYSCS